MNIGQIRFFVSAVELGSFSRVAKQQGVTVQAVSKAIIGLEGQLGNDLFTRGSRGGVTPTEFGVAFFDKARSALESFDGLENFSRSFTAAHRGPVLRLALETPLFRDYGKICTGIAQRVGRALGFKMEIIHSNDADVMHMLSTGEVDGLVTLGEPPQPEFDHFAIGSVRVGVVMRADHELAAGPGVTPEAANRFLVGLPKHFGGFNAAFLGFFERIGLKPHTIEIENHDHYLSIIDHEAAIVPCVAMNSLIEPRRTSEVCIRPFLLGEGEGPATTPVVINTLAAFKSPQYEEYAQRMRGVPIF